MARPTKQGIDYFPLDCQFDDKTEMFLIETGANGFATLITLWQMIYSNEGYYIINNDDLHLLVKRKIDVGINEVSGCINTALRRNLFNPELHDKHGILTSKAIQKRFFDAAKKKKEVSVIKNYLRIPVDSYPNFVSVDDNPVNVDGNATKEKEEVKVKEEVKETNSDFESLWIAYGKKGNKKTSHQKFMKLKAADIALIKIHLPKYVQSTPTIQFRKDFQTYINQECWNDEILNTPTPDKHSGFKDRDYSKGATNIEDLTWASQ